MLEPIENQYFLIGRINRSHGVDGEVMIISRINAPSLFDEIDLLLLKNSRGDLVPARIESVRTEEKRNRLSFFVKFEHVTDRNQADELKGWPVFAEREVAKRLVAEASDPASDFTSFEVYDDNDRHIGTVERVIDNPAHPILQVATGDNRQLLVPFVDEYVVSADEESNILRCHNLEQLDDL